LQLSYADATARDVFGEDLHQFLGVCPFCEDHENESENIFEEVLDQHATESNNEEGNE